MMTNQEWGQMEDMLRRVIREELTRYQGRLVPPRLVPPPFDADQPPPMVTPVPSPTPPDKGTPGQAYSRPHHGGVGDD